MKVILKYFIFCLFILFSIVSLSQSNSTKETTYYFIRHSEKERGDDVGKNPHLTQAGKKRAESWRAYFEDIDLDEIYSTDYYRTVETAQPTAISKNLKIKMYDPNNLYSEKFQFETKGKTVLVVGHSNTTPSFVNKVLGENFYKQIDDSNNSNLYVVNIIDGVISHRLILVD